MWRNNLYGVGSPLYLPTHDQDKGAVLPCFHTMYQVGGEDGSCPLSQGERWLSRCC
jgi:hypothetical protein